MPTPLPPADLLEFGRATGTTPDEPDDFGSREWLATNGIGGYAAGTIAGQLERRYHGLLVAALVPPLGRTMLVAICEETAA